jgi:Protein kinase domain
LGIDENGQPFYTMKMVRGITLRKVLELLAAGVPETVKKYPLPALLTIFQKVCDALAFAHSKGVIHRDLKPENIMVAEMRGDPDFVKVLDFGIAKIQDGGAQTKLTQAGLVCGTPEYMSPEQARGLELDARSDLYSAGVILYQMVTGTLPFSADNPIGYVTAHLTDVPEPAAKRRADISKGLSDLIDRTLSKNRNDRPATARQMREAIAALERPQSPGMALPQELITTQYGPARLRSPERRGSALWLAGLLLLALGVSAFAAYRLRPAARAVANGASAPGNPTTAAVPAPPSPSATALSNVATEAVGANREGNQLYQRAIAEDDADKRNGYLREAIKAYYHASQLSPGYAAPLRGLGMCYQARGDPGDTEKAAAHYRKYLESVPTPLDADAVRQQMAGLSPN